MKEVEELLNREPFESFRFVLTSGQSYTVRNPSCVALGARRVFLYFDQSDRSAFFPYLHIAAIETVGNGHKGSKRRR